MNLPGQFSSWEELYQNWGDEMMPWYYADLDPDVEMALRTYKIQNGKLLDLGTGPGTQAIALAKQGFEVTATDISRQAIENARKKAESENLEIEFRQDNILKTKLTMEFDVVLDRGCFHVFDKNERETFIEVIHKLVNIGGYLLLKCFSQKEPGEEGPHRFLPAQIDALFSSRFWIESIDETVYYGMRDPMPQALFCVMRKV